MRSPRTEVRCRVVTIARPTTTPEWKRYPTCQIFRCAFAIAFLQCIYLDPWLQSNSETRLEPRILLGCIASLGASNSLGREFLNIPWFKFRLVVLDLLGPQSFRNPSRFRPPSWFVALLRLSVGSILRKTACCLRFCVYFSGTRKCKLAHSL